VLHGFFSVNDSVVLNGLSREYDPDDDVAVRFDDPTLRFEWPSPNPVLSERDRDAPMLDELLAELRRHGVSFPAPA
jgi:dTDP-4-dehydrorhamnose 3,5-epimerase